MALEFNTIGVKLKWASEATKGSRPTSGYVQIPDIKGTPAIDINPNKLQVTNLEDEYHRFVDGVKSVGDSFDFTANLTADLKAKWASCVAAAESAWSCEKSTWFEISIPNFDSFYFAGIPTEMGVNEMGVDAVIESTLHIVPNAIGGWASASS